MDKYKGIKTEGIMILENCSNDIRYLMIGVLVDSKFNGMISDYTGGGEFTEYYYIDNEMVDGDDMSDTLPKELCEKIDAFMDENDIGLDEVGNYIYTGDMIPQRNMQINYLTHNEEPSITPVEVGNTIFEKKDETLTPSEVEFNVLQNQPEFKHYEYDWWHSYTINGLELDIQYLNDEDEMLYVYEIVDGERVEDELMIIPITWGFDTTTNKYRKRD